MKMAKVDLIKDLLVKINNVFSDDMFIIRNRIVVSGIKSFEKANGRYVCVLNENIKQEYDAVLGVDSITKVVSIKDAKKSFNDNIVVVDKIDEFETVDQHMINASLEVYDNAIKIEEWEPLESILTPEELDGMFNRGESTLIFGENDQPRMRIGKSLLPLVKEKNIGDVYFSPMTEIENNVFRAFFKIEHPYFVAYLCFWLLK